MKDTSRPLAAKQTLLLILVPMLATFVLLRLFLHLAGVRHAYPFGHLVHHLFWGVLLLIPAAFLLAFSTKTPSVAAAARVAVGIGSALALDELSYLVLTEASDSDYVSRVSLYGAVIFISLAVILLLSFYFGHRD